MLRTLPHVPATMAELVDPQATALVMWDMQVGLAGKSIHRSTVEPAAHLLLAAADAAGILVVWSRHILPPLELTVAPFLQFLMRKQKVGDPRQLKPFMQVGSAEAEFLPGFVPRPHHVVLEKSMPSLFVDTPLDLRLKAARIRTIVLVGVATDIGVEFTARHAVAKGYFAVVAEDAVGAYSDAAQVRSLSFLREWSTVVQSAEITNIWERAR